MNSEFLKNLASESPAPGGGTASALAGAMGAALLSMVAKLSRKTASVANEISEQAETLMTLCAGLAREDEEAFESVVAAYKLPRKTEDEKRARSAAVEHSLKSASKVPLRSAKASLETLRLAESFLAQSNRNALSDVGVATLLAKAAMEGAILNVLINLASIKDKEFIEQCMRDSQGFTEEGEACARRVMKEIYDDLRAPLSSR